MISQVGELPNRTVFRGKSPSRIPMRSGRSSVASQLTSQSPAYEQSTRASSRSESFSPSRQSATSVSRSSSVSPHRYNSSSRIPHLRSGSPSLPRQRQSFLAEKKGRHSRSTVRSSGSNSSGGGSRERPRSLPQTPELRNNDDAKSSDTKKRSDSRNSEKIDNIMLSKADLKMPRKSPLTPTLMTKSRQKPMTPTSDMVKTTKEKTVVKDAVKSNKNAVIQNDAMRSDTMLDDRSKSITPVLSGRQESKKTGPKVTVPHSDSREHSRSVAVANSKEHSKPTTDARQDLTGQAIENLSQAKLSNLQSVDNVNGSKLDAINNKTQLIPDKALMEMSNKTYVINSPVGKETLTHKATLSKEAENESLLKNKNDGHVTATFQNSHVSGELNGDHFMQRQTAIERSQQKNKLAPSNEMKLTTPPSGNHLNNDSNSKLDGDAINGKKDLKATDTEEQLGDVREDKGKKGQGQLNEVRADRGKKGQGRALSDDEHFKHLQEEYNNLLTRYAAAENTIDELRLGTRVALYSDTPTPIAAQLGSIPAAQQAQTIVLGKVGTATMGKVETKPMKASMGMVTQTGNMGMMAQSGNMGIIGQSGSMGIIGQSGSMVMIGQSENMGMTGQSGNMGKMAQSGSMGMMAQSGNMGMMEQSGNMDMVALSRNKGMVAQSRNELSSLVMTDAVTEQPLSNERVLVAQRPDVNNKTSSTGNVTNQAVLKGYGHTLQRPDTNRNSFVDGAGMKHAVLYDDNINVSQPFDSKKAAMNGIGEKGSLISGHGGSVKSSGSRAAVIESNHIDLSANSGNSFFLVI